MCTLAVEIGGFGLNPVTILEFLPLIFSIIAAIVVLLAIFGCSAANSSNVLASQYAVCVVSFLSWGRCRTLPT